MHDDIKWFLGFIVIIAIAGITGWKAQRANPPVAEKAVPVVEKQIPPERKVEEDVKRIQADLKKAEEEKNTSPLKGKVLVQGVSAGGSNEYVLLEVPSAETAPVVITGLKLHSLKGNLDATVPRGWGLPFPDMQGEGELVSLKPGERAYVITGYSANGLSFRLNRCTGYLEQGRDFSPSLPLQCPSPVQEPLPEPPNQLSDACLDYLERIPLCTTASIPSHLQNDGGCQSHLQKIGYDRCVSIYKPQPNFFTPEWRLFLSRGAPLWTQRHDTIELRDREGKLISSYSY